jgi:hypothetical protein
MDDRTLLDLGTVCAELAEHDAGDQLDRELDARSPAFIREDPDV